MTAGFLMVPGGCKRICFQFLPYESKIESQIHTGADGKVAYPRLVGGEIENMAGC